ncbi:Substrate-specific component BioY of biotin ECF transporter, partial [uncultured Rubrobacteraceae bacterium]
PDRSGPGGLAGRTRLGPGTGVDGGGDDAGSARDLRFRSGLARRLLGRPVDRAGPGDADLHPWRPGQDRDSHVRAARWMGTGAPGRRPNPIRGI